MKLIMVKIARFLIFFTCFYSVLGASGIISKYYSRDRVSLHVNYDKNLVPSLLIIEVDGHQVYSLLLNDDKNNYKTHFSARYTDGLEISVAETLASGAPKGFSIIINDEFIDRIVWHNNLGYLFTDKEELDRIIESQKKQSLDDIVF
jgi:hypothetical protein